MALQQQNLQINFSQGLNKKVDPFQLAPGNFESLVNSIFDIQGRLTKRNGFGTLTQVPDTTYTFITTYNGNLITLGESLAAYSTSTDTWTDRGTLKPIQVAVQSLVKDAANQIQADSAQSSNGLTCIVYSNGSNISASSHYYTIQDAVTGQTIVSPVNLITLFGNIPAVAPKVFFNGTHFLILNKKTSSPNLQLAYIPQATPTATPTVITIANSAGDIFDAVVANSKLWILYHSTSNDMELVYVNTNFSLSSVNTYSPGFANIRTASIAADSSVSPAVIYASSGGTLTGVNTVETVIAQDSGSNTITTLVSPTITYTGTPIPFGIASVAENAVCTLVFGTLNTASIGPGAGALLYHNTIDQAGSTTGLVSTVRSTILASKAFTFDSTVYYLTLSLSLTQPTYFLMNLQGQVVAKLAYSNSPHITQSSDNPYLYGLPNVTVDGSYIKIPYLVAQEITPVNKSQGVLATQGVYSQLGINLASFNMQPSEQPSSFITAEAAGDLHITGGFLWMYDGFQPVEHGFFAYPDITSGSASLSGGGLTPQEYFYQVVYQWTDNQGNLHQSAPSIPAQVDTSAFTSVTSKTFQAVFTNGSTLMTASSTADLYVGQQLTDTTTPGNVQAGTVIVAFLSGTTVQVSLPFAGSSAASPGDTLKTIDTVKNTLTITNLRLTYKITNPVTIAIYRWSTAQPIYYATTFISNPILNDTSVDSFTYVDTQNDYAISGNQIIYTNGGVLENIVAPATNSIALYQSRLFLIDAEDPNLLWFSKTILESTPVEMSDLLTLFVAPTIGATGSTGELKTLYPMDDKLILGKKNALYYINGQGPDNTGANNQYSEPTFITGTVGCSNQNSMVLIPQGIMFQSEKGIWLLGRDLSTNFIGAPVESFTMNANITSAIVVEGTNQVRFQLDSGITLLYDYYYGQWGTFVGMPCISSTIYQSQHTLLNASGEILKESPGLYLDGAEPVLMSFKTGWLSLAGLQGYERVWEIDLLGQYVSPFSLSASLAYNYNGVAVQNTTINSSSPIFHARLFPARQRCESFQLTVDENYTGTPGAAFTLSGLNLIVGIMRNRRISSAAKSFG